LGSVRRGDLPRRLSTFKKSLSRRGFKERLQGEASRRGFKESPGDGIRTYRGF
jgi:hypothetical protein